MTETYFVLFTDSRVEQMELTSWQASEVLKKDDVMAVIGAKEEDAQEIAKRLGLA